MYEELEKGDIVGIVVLKVGNDPESHINRANVYQSAVGDADPRNQLCSSTCTMFS
jgi:hypothetical protein